MIDLHHHITAVETLRRTMVKRCLSVNDVARMTGKPKGYIRAALAGRLSKRKKVDALIDRITEDS